MPYAQIPIETIRAVSKDFAFAYEWLNERGYRVDVSAVRQIHPVVMDIRAWLDNSGAAKITEFLATQGPGSGDTSSRPAD